MINWLKNFITVEFTIARNYTNSIENIIGGFTKTVEDLEAHAVEHSKQMIAKTEEAGRLLYQRGLHSDEVARAKALSQRISSLIS